MELADILTVAGVAGSAAVVTGLIQLLKTVFKQIDNGLEQPLALVASAVLVVLAIIDSNVFTLPQLFTGFLAWLSIAKLATGIYDEVTQQPGAFTSNVVVDSP